MKALLTIVFWLVTQAAVPQLAFAQTAAPQTVVVKSGDHPGFTRLVLELPQATDWAMGRTDDGYELRLTTAGARFDLTRVFDGIQRDRLAAIWADPATGGLRMGIACACHAIPFEFRPGLIVVDLRDGPPPRGSSFELSLDGAKTADLAAKLSPRPRARPQSRPAPRSPGRAGAADYDWLSSSKPEAIGMPANRPVPLILAVPEKPDFGPLKEALLRQLGRGAAQGIVQMARPSLSARNAGDPLPSGPRANIRLGATPGFEVAARRGPENLLIADGADCIADDRLDLAKWGNDLPAPIQLADARANLIGEFDKPNPDAVIKAIRLLIHFGFGAEAQQLMQQMPVKTADQALWISLAKLVDGQADPGGPFSAMLACDSAAALWAVVASPQLTQGDQPRIEAVLRAFSALPTQLRSSLGPDLSAKFLAIDDVATAQTLQNAVLRATRAPTPDTAVMQAQLALAAGDPNAAAAHLKPMLAQPGPATADALIALVDTQIATEETVAPETALAIAGLVRERAGSSLDPALRRAQILALGSSGDFDQAFDLLPDTPEAARDLWMLLARSGSAAAILVHAVLPTDAVLPALDPVDRNLIASQLMALGLAEPALVWIGASRSDAPEDVRITAAAARILNGDPAAALASLDKVGGTVASDLRAQAWVALDQPEKAAAAFADAGNPDAETRAQSWARDWDSLARNDTSSWQPAAAFASAPPVKDPSILPGPLALGNALVADSARARATVLDLLSRVPRPVP